MTGFWIDFEDEVVRTCLTSDVGCSGKTRQGGLQCVCPEQLEE